jgi:hypothetical protein
VASRGKEEGLTKGQGGSQSALCTDFHSEKWAQCQRIVLSLATLYSHPPLYASSDCRVFPGISEVLRRERGKAGKGLVSFGYVFLISSTSRLSIPISCMKVMR